ncbi:LysR substrate-binding domain-containing protein [Solirubrobacter phytolaccae]|uniref:LysR substrate-binding domain-containing protein n=1 Tax=Solirubrobacter phytolaccae TaxID=1404360 RepID=A0A9X3NG11_9ACTN|nr:LysR substrate-binding domain-containing protein [Solirubrobacter phytolaccae]MDA0184629.1 LysR substrate-binding domain-containing protein [Solirubrobacter phytolaccae]
MRLEQLEYFLASAEHGSFSAAAASLLMAQPSMSEQIRRLEAELGVPLFIRAGKGVELTDAGRLFLPHAERVLAEAQEALESVREVRTLVSGTVAFGFFGGAHHSLLTGLIARFRAKYPDVRVRAIGQNSAEVADAVREAQLEAGLVILPIEDRGLEVRPVLSEELFYMTADPERARVPMTIERLAEAPLILYDARWAAQDPTRVQLSERGQVAGVRVEPLIEVEYMTAAFDLAARGLGDTVGLPSMLRARKLHQVAFDPPLFETYAFITRRNALLSPSTRAFMELAEKALG